MEYLAECITVLLENNGIIKTERKIYKYGFEGLISSIIGTVFLIGLGIVLNSLFEAILYECVYSTLRKYVGGYHCKTHITCIIVYNSIFIIYLSIQNFLNFNLPILLLLLLITNMLIIKFAPIRNENKLLTSIVYKRNKKIGLIYSGLISLIILILFYNNHQSYKLLLFIFVIIGIFIIGGEIENESSYV